MRVPSINRVRNCNQHTLPEEILALFGFRECSTQRGSNVGEIRTSLIERRSDGRF